MLQFSRLSQYLTMGVLGFVMLIALGCTTTRPTVSADPEQRERELSEGYALLYNVLQDNRRVNLAPYVPFRSVSDETNELLNAIAKASGDAADQLYDLAEAAPSIGLDDDGLPRVESATRDAIADTTESNILSGDADRFELYLLLSQADATRYVSHLAAVLGEMDEHGARRAFAQRVRDQFEQLYEKVITRLDIDG